MGYDYEGEDFARIDGFALNKTSGTYTVPVYFGSQL